MYFLDISPEMRQDIIDSPDLTSGVYQEVFMKTIALDIGTTTICGILIDSRSGELLESRTYSNDSGISDTLPWEKCQDPVQILSYCMSILDEFRQIARKESDDISSIGLTGQMHGILYLDASGHAVSPLYTWQDERGNQPFSENNTYASYLSRITGYPMATGYGLTTHFYMVHNDLVPVNADVFCTIQDFVAMSLVHSAAPMVHCSDAASFGLFNIGKNVFEPAALQQAGIDPVLLPLVTKETKTLGLTPDGIPVSVAIGDNQASFIGSVCDPDAILVNVGTGSQVSARVHSVTSMEDLQFRPFPDSGILCVGSPLCGGYSYAVLKEFFMQAASLFDGAQVPANLYQKMDAAAQEVYSSGQPLIVDTRFRGARENPKLRGRIENISPANLTPGHLCLGVLKGICSELYSLFRKIPDGPPRTTLIGSGNGIRSSPLLQQIFTDTFGLELKIPLYKEEAAYGAALFSLCACGYCRSLQEAQDKIKYK